VILEKQSRHRLGSNRASPDLVRIGVPLDDQKVSWRDGVHAAIRNRSLQKRNVREIEVRSVNVGNA
jgi:hypothetical protein